jgi:ankyrin repeat protein
VLLEHDADFTAEDNDGYRAIHVAAEQGHTEAVELLLHVGEQVVQLCGAAANELTRARAGGLGDS